MVSEEASQELTSWVVDSLSSDSAFGKSTWPGSPYEESASARRGSTFANLLETFCARAP